MQESIYKYMKVGIAHFTAYPQVEKGEGPILETLGKIAEDDFFTAVEITQIKDREIRRKARDLLEMSHLAVGYGAHIRLLIKKMDINSSENSERKKALRELKDSVNEAYEMGAETVAFMSGKDPGEEKREEAYKRLIDSTKQICDYARSQGDLMIALKAYDQGTDKKCLIGPAAQARRVAENIRKGFNNFGLQVDLAHLPLLNETPTQSIMPIRNYLVQADLGNCVLKDKNHPVYGDHHPRFGIKGGENDVPEVVAFLRVLWDINFLNPESPPVVGLTVQPHGDETSEIVITNGKRVLKEAWAKL